MVTDKALKLLEMKNFLQNHHWVRQQNGWINFKNKNLRPVSIEEAYRIALEETLHDLTMPTN